MSKSITVKVKRPYSQGIIVMINIVKKKKCDVVECIGN